MRSGFRTLLLGHWKRHYLPSRVSVLFFYILKSKLSSIFIFFRDKMMDYEVACLDITPLGKGKAHFIAVGLWTEVSALILNVPGLDVITTEPMKGGIDSYNLITKYKLIFQ
jgi:hypothetical protein